MVASDGKIYKKGEGESGDRPSGERASEVLLEGGVEGEDGVVVPLIERRHRFFNDIQSAQLRQALVQLPVIGVRISATHTHKRGVLIRITTAVRLGLRTARVRPDFHLRLGHGIVGPQHVEDEMSAYQGQQPTAKKKKKKRKKQCQHEIASSRTNLNMQGGREAEPEDGQTTRGRVVETRQSEPRQRMEEGVECGGEVRRRSRLGPASARARARRLETAHRAVATAPVGVGSVQSRKKCAGSAQKTILADIQSYCK